MTQSIWLKPLICNKFSPKQTKRDNMYKFQIQIHSGSVFCLLSFFSSGISVCVSFQYIWEESVKNCNSLCQNSFFMWKTLFHLSALYISSFWATGLRKSSVSLHMGNFSLRGLPVFLNMSKAGLIRTWSTELLVRISHVQQHVLPQLQEHHWGSASSQAGRNPKLVIVLAQVGPYAMLLTPRLLPAKQSLSAIVCLDL